MDQPAYSVVSARAVYGDGVLVIRAKIEVTATNFEPYLERSPILIYPPPHEFLAMERRTAPIGGDMIIPKTVTQVFPTPGGKPKTITIRARTNKLEVNVEDIDPLAPSTQVLLGAFQRGQEGGAYQIAGGGEIPSAHSSATAFNDTTIGYSYKMNFEEALEDAIRKLPPPPGVDLMQSIRVTAIGAEIGGVAGIRRLWVGISRIWLKA